ncbi:MAG: response regulator [Paracoccaceae bacterium]
MAIVDSQNDVSSEQISILIADDHELILDIARLYLDQQSDMSVSTAMTLNDAIDTYQKAGPFDVVLLDYNMPGMNGLEGLRQMMALAPGIPVAIITGNPTRPLMNDVLEAGAAGIVSKSSPVKSLANSIRFIHSGETYMPLNLTLEDPKKQRGDTGPLSSREMTVLSYLGEGKKNKQIAVSLGLSEGTVKMHVMSICKKLDATNRTHAVINARNTGLL